MMPARLRTANSCSRNCTGISRLRASSPIGTGAVPQLGECEHGVWRLARDRDHLLEHHASCIKERSYCAGRAARPPGPPPAPAALRNARLGAAPSTHKLSGSAITIPLCFARLVLAIGADGPAPLRRRGKAQSAEYTRWPSPSRGAPRPSGRPRPGGQVRRRALRVAAAAGRGAWALQPAALGRDQHGLGAIDRAELAVDVVQVRAHCARREGELVSDLLVDLALGESLQHAELTPRQRAWIDVALALAG